MRPKLLAVLHWQFEGSALEMAHKDLEVVGIHVGMFGRGVEEVFRMFDDVLVQGGGRGDQHRDRGVVAPSRPPGPLPGGGDRARIACQHDRVQGPDINAEFQGVCGDNAKDLPVAQFALDLPPLSGKVPAAVASDRSGRTGLLAERFLEVAC